MRSIMYNNRLNHLMVLHMDKKVIDKVDIQDKANKVIAMKD